MSWSNREQTTCFVQLCFVFSVDGLGAERGVFPVVASVGVCARAVVLGREQYDYTVILAAVLYAVFLRIMTLHTAFAGEHWKYKSEHLRQCFILIIEMQELQCGFFFCSPYSTDGVLLRTVHILGES